MAFTVYSLVFIYSILHRRSAESKRWHYYNLNLCAVFATFLIFLLLVSEEFFFFLIQIHHVSNFGAKRIKKKANTAELRTPTPRRNIHLIEPSAISFPATYSADKVEAFFFSYYIWNLILPMGKKIKVHTNINHYII